MARVRFTHPQPNISREDVRSRRRRRLRLERRRCRQHLRRMLFLPCGFNRRRHSAPGDRTRHTVPARTRGAWDTPARGRASRHDMTRSKRRRRLRSSALRVERHRREAMAAAAAAARRLDLRRPRQTTGGVIRLHT